MSLRPDIVGYFDAEVRKRKGILASEYLSEFNGRVRRTVGPFASADHNWVDYFDPTTTDVAEAVADEVAFFKSIGHSFRWKLYSHDEPVETARTLLEQGFKAWQPCSLMIVDVPAFRLQFPDGIEFRRVDEPDELPGHLKRIQDEVWDEGADRLIAALCAEMRDMGRHMRIHVARRRGATIGCGLIRFNETMTFGGLFAGATVPSERGKGVYRGMVSARVEDARQCQAEYLYTEAGPMSRPILGRLGFETVATVTSFAFDADDGE